MSTIVPDAQRRPEQGEDTFDLQESPPKRRMLIVVNPYASTVSDSLRHVVVDALRSRFEVDARDTESRGHATELCREAAHEGYDVVVAFGDGTVNEAANGLLGSATPLTCLPGGSANVFGKMLGIPGSLVEATEHLLAMADDWRIHKVDLGVVNGRCFTFASGLGLDASVVQRVDANPRRKARWGPWFFTWVAVTTFARPYLLRPPRLTTDLAGEEHHGVTAVTKTAPPSPTSATAESRSPRTRSSTPARSPPASRTAPDRSHMPFIAGAPSPSVRAVNAPPPDHRALTPVTELTVRTADGEPLPLQVHGDYLGEVAEARY